MKIKTYELTGAALRWMIGVAEGYEMNIYGVDKSIRARVPGLGVYAPWAPDKYWSQGGPIIERERLNLHASGAGDWMVSSHDVQHPDRVIQYDTTPLIAAMRYYVASKLGDEVEVPDSLGH